MRWTVGLLVIGIVGCGSAEAVSSAREDDPSALGDSSPPVEDAVSDTFDPPRPPARLVFDATKGERSGGADWVIDTSGQFPSPSHPKLETEWQGGISAWGVAIHQAGYDVEVLPGGGRITFGDPSNQQDLSRYDVYIVPEPNNPFTATEATAMVEFVRAGGGLFVIADHGKSDRDSDGWDSPRAWNDVFDRTGNPFGLSFAADNFTDSPDDNVLDDPASKVLHGGFGDVRATTYYAGSSMRIDATKNASVRALIWRRGAAHSGVNVTLATAELGKGRVVAIGDSSPADDGTGSGKLLDGWDDPKGNNRALFLNATAWLAHRD